MNSEIVKKFGIEKFHHKLILNMPAEIRDFDGMSFSTAFEKDNYDLIFAFVFSLEEFVALLKTSVAGKFFAYFKFCISLLPHW